ncbi:MAG: hypothetical protein KBC48_00985 [Candidatus Pacebacteria bacterium]|nr:hypothetical protein [Candidatus Paceibacterota bacterium]
MSKLQEIAKGLRSLLEGQSTFLEKADQEKALALLDQLDEEIARPDMHIATYWGAP